MSARRTREWGRFAIPGSVLILQSSIPNLHLKKRDASAAKPPTNAGNRRSVKLPR